MVEVRIEIALCHKVHTLSLCLFLCVCLLYAHEYAWAVHVTIFINLLPFCIETEFLTELETPGFS